MTPGMHRLLIGGIGGLAPVFALLVAVDFEANLVNASTGKIAGYAVRALALFMIGGFVAWLHEKEHEPFKLFELGMGGPALLAGLITSNSIVASAPVKPAGPGIASLLVPAAHAQVTVHAPTARFGEPIRIKSFSIPQDEGANGFWQGLTGAKPENVYFVIAGSHPSYEAARSQADRINATNGRFKAEVYAPYGDNPYYAVVLGSNMKRDDARALRMQAVQAGLPRDSYLWTFPGFR